MTKRRFPIAYTTLPCALALAVACNCSNDDGTEIVTDLTQGNMMAEQAVK